MASHIVSTSRSSEILPLSSTLNWSSSATNSDHHSWLTLLSAGSSGGGTFTSSSVKRIVLCVGPASLSLLALIFLVFSSARSWSAPHSPASAALDLVFHFLTPTVSFLSSSSWASAFSFSFAKLSLHQNPNQSHCCANTRPIICPTILTVRLKWSTRMKLGLQHFSSTFANKTANTF